MRRPERAHRHQQRNPQTKKPGLESHGEPSSVLVVCSRGSAAIISVKSVARECNSRHRIFPSELQILLFSCMAAKRSRMLRRSASIFAALLCVTTVFVSITISRPPQTAQSETELLQRRFARLKHGINLSHWFAQSADY